MAATQQRSAYTTCKLGEKVATKKQKRAAALARRERFLAAEREVGLNALRIDRERRAYEERKLWQEQHDKKHSWKKRIKECPLCQDEIKLAKTVDRFDADVKV
jgi:hypothetical protein